MKWLGPGTLSVRENGEPKRLQPGDEIPQAALTKERIEELVADKKIDLGAITEPSIKVDVGVMEATVKAGDDGKLGTEDDEVEVKPKKRGRPPKKKEAE